MLTTNWVYMVSNFDDIYVHILYNVKINIIYYSRAMPHHVCNYFVTAMVCVQAYGLNCKDEATSYQYYCLHDQSQAT